MTTIDSHHHLWKLGTSPYAWLDDPRRSAIRKDMPFEALRIELDRFGLQQSIVIQADNTAADAQYMRLQALAQPRIAGFVGWAPLAEPASVIAAALDAQAAGGKLLGLRHTLSHEPDDNWIVRPQVLENLSVLEARGLTFEYNCDRPVYLTHVPTIAKHCPHLHLIIDHVGKPPLATRAWEPWASHFAAAAEFPNVYVKLSGLTTPLREGWSGEDFKPYVQFALKTFGARRLMYASNWPVTLLAGDYESQWNAMKLALGPLSEEDAAAIYGGSAERCYRLGI